MGAILAKGRQWARRAVMLFLLTLAAPAWVGSAQAGCSSYLGKAFLNEYYFGPSSPPGNFLEVYSRDKSVDTAAWQGWTIDVYGSSGSATTYTLNTSTATECVFGSRRFITYNVSDLPQGKAFVVLKDAAGQEVDVVVFDNTNPPDPYDSTPWFTPSCTTLKNALDAQKALLGIDPSQPNMYLVSNYSNKDLARTPDGGNWSITGLTGANTTYTQCKSNDPIAIGKTVSNSSPAPGQTVNFTVSIYNNTTKSIIGITALDLLPTGLTCGTATPTTGTYSCVTGTWIVPSLASQTGATLTIPATVTATSGTTITNTATVIAPVYVPPPTDSASLTVASGFNHIRLLHNGTGLTCQPSVVTVKACMDANCTSLYPGSVTLTLAPTGWLGGDSITFSGGQTATSLSQTTPSTVTLGTSGISPAPLASPATRCFVGATESCSLIFSDAGFLFDVPDHASCSDQSVVIQAVKKSDSAVKCVPAFQNVTKQVRFWSTYGDPATGTLPVKVNGASIAAASPGTAVSVSFDANAQSTLTVNYADVGQMQLNASYTGSMAGGDPGVNAMGSDLFVAKPAAFVLSGIKRTSDSVANPAAADATGTAFIRAGDPFTVTAEARNACGNATPNFGKESTAEGVKLAPGLVSGLGLTNNPAIGFTAGFGAFSGGSATGTDFSWGEVGIITLTPTIKDGDYLGAGDVSGTTSGNVGRFIPHHFALISPAVTNRSSLSCSPASNYTYMGENLGVAFTLQAQNASNGATQNYRSDSSPAKDFAKLDGATASKWTAYGTADSLGLWGIGTMTAPYAACKAVFAAASPYNTTYSTGAPGCPTSPPSPIAQSPVSPRIALAASPAPSGSWVAGSGTFGASLTVGRAAVADGPYQVSLGAAPQDKDGVTLLSSALDLDADNSGGSERKLLGQAELRYGRLHLSNAYGSELLALPVPLEAQYRTNAGFYTRNLDDSCTTIPASSIALGSYTQNLAACETQISLSGALTGGRANLTLTKPGGGNNGSVLLTLNAGDAAVGNTCTSAAETLVTAANMLWFGANPAARATFGIYKTPIIYFRENF